MSEVLHIKDPHSSALERLRAQILYATRGRSRPTRFEVPADEYARLVSEVRQLEGINSVPMIDTDEDREHIVVYDVVVLKAV